MASIVVRKITPEQTPLKLKGPPAGEKPLYLYLDKKQRFIIASDNILALFRHPEVDTPLEVSPEGISFLLQSGVIPTPRTIFKNLFVLNIGDFAEVKAGKKGLEIFFGHEFLYPASRRTPEIIPDEKRLLELLAQAVLTRLQPGAPVYLFQSLGKDSNTIALALAEAGFKEVTCLTLSTGDRKDESEIAAKIAWKFGFPHRKLPVPEKISKRHKDEIIFYFENIPLPCVDGVSLAYPLYATQLDFRGTNIIDGSGNDIYMGHVPRKIEYQRQKIYPHFLFLRWFAEKLPTGNAFQKLARTRTEMVGALGFSYRDARRIYPLAEPVFPFWQAEDRKRKGWDYFDLKADVWGPNFEFDLVMRKVRNFAAVYNAHLIMPWTDAEVAAYVASFPEKYLYDRKNFKNKLFLRQILKKYLGIDSDALGKYSYGFNAYLFLQKMSPEAEEEILKCSLWNPKGVKKVLDRLSILARQGNRMARKLWVRLYLLSAWYNYNRYIKR